MLHLKIYPGLDLSQSVAPLILLDWIVHFINKSFVWIIFINKNIWNIEAGIENRKDW